MFARLFNSRVDFDDFGNTNRFTSKGLMDGTTIVDATKKLFAPAIGTGICAARMIYWCRITNIAGGASLSFTPRFRFTQGDADSNAIVNLAFISGKTANDLFVIDRADSDTPWDAGTTPETNPWGGNTGSLASASLDGIPFPILNEFICTFATGDTGDLADIELFVMAQGLFHQTLTPEGFGWGL